MKNIKNENVTAYMEDLSDLSMLEELKNSEIMVSVDAMSGYNSMENPEYTIEEIACICYFNEIITLEADKTHRQISFDINDFTYDIIG